jgi:hypothetical protein
MGSSRRGLRASLWLYGSLLATANASSTNFSTLPANVEVDLIFPRPNETYQPVYPFPIIFALRGAAATLDYDLQLEWELLPPGNVSYNGENGGSLFQEDLAAVRGNATYYMIQRTTAINSASKNPTWGFQWFFNLAPNCSTPIGNTMATNLTVQVGNIHFYTSPTGKLPDIIPDDGSCPLPLVAYTVANHEYYPNEGRGAYSGDCLVLNQLDQPPLPSPCDVKANSSLVAQVSQKLTADMKCPGTTWPDPTFNGTCTSGAWRLRAGGMSSWLLDWRLMVFVCFVIWR